MKMTRTTVPGVGFVHHCVTRSGAHFGVLVDQSGHRKLLVYGPSAANESSDSDEPLATIELQDDEADQLADILHSRPIPDRMAELERRFKQLAESAR